MCETSELVAWTMALNLPGYEVSHCAEDGIDGVLRLSVDADADYRTLPGLRSPLRLVASETMAGKHFGFPAGRSAGVV